MKIDYFPDTDTLYIGLADRPSVDSEEVAEGVVLDFDLENLSILENVGAEGIVITEHGKPVAKLIPIGTESASLIGALKGRLTIKGEILSTGAKKAGNKYASKSTA